LELLAALGANDLQGIPEKQPAVGKGDLTVAIQVAGLAMSAVGTLIAVLTYWRGRTKIPPTIIVVHEDRSVTLGEEQDAEKIARELGIDGAKPNSELRVTVTEQGT
jgi:ATP-dependent protease ClpP protease subunit